MMLVMAKPQPWIVRAFQSFARRADLAPRAGVAGLDAAYRRLLDATAKEAWAQGVHDAASVLSDALRRERERVASEAPRGLLHMHPGEGSRDATEIAARAVVDALVDLAVARDQSALPLDERERLLVNRPISDELRKRMVRNARWFMLRYGQGLDEDEAYRQLDEPTDRP
jgi:hypothetical protein